MAQRACVQTLGVGTVVLLGTALALSGPVWSEDESKIGSTQRFRGVVGEALGEAVDKDFLALGSSQRLRGIAGGEQERMVAQRPQVFGRTHRFAGLARIEKAKDRLAAEAKITLEQAVKAATEKVPGKVTGAELQQRNDRAVWEVDVLSIEGKEVRLSVDAETGSFVELP